MNIGLNSIQLPFIVYSNTDCYLLWSGNQSTQSQQFQEPRDQYLYWISSELLVINMESNETDDRQWHQQINMFTYEAGSNSTDNNNYSISSVNTTSGWGVSPVPPAVTATFGIVGNIVAILVLFRSSRIHKWKTFYRLVCALAVTDLFGIISTTPVVLLVYANGIQFIGGQPVCDYLAFMMVFAGIATLLIVTTMSFDRFVAVWHPYAYSSTLTHKRIFVTLLLIWCIATMLGSLPIFGFGHNILQYPGTWCFFNFYSRQIVDSIFCILYSGVGLLVISLTTIMNILVSVKIRTTKRRPRKLSDHHYRTCRSNASQIIFLIAISVVFSICWLPLMVSIEIFILHSNDKTL